MLSFLAEKWFQFIHSNFLVYNISWEDADVDRELLDIDPGSNIFMITGAGCNVLTYLLDDPKHITTVDYNYRQNALLEFKMALFHNGNYENVRSLFIDGKSEDYKSIYHQVRAILSEQSQKFWDKNIYYFKPEGKGFYYNGTSGFFARFFNFLIDRKGLRSPVQKLLNMESQSERLQLYKKIEPKIWSGLSGSFWNSNGALSLVGVPDAQAKAVPNLKSFIRSVIPEVFVNNHPGENHYWRVYLEGKYSEECCPAWLKKKNFDLIKNRLDRIHFKTSGVIDFLTGEPKTYSHFVLLDHMDWFADNDPEALVKEWQLILKYSKPGTRILFRTAYPDLDFLPAFVFDKVDFISQEEMNLEHDDKVGTYTGTYLGMVK